MQSQTPQIKSVFAAALDFDSHEERNAFLDAACGDDSRLRQQVESLLAAHWEANGFLSRAVPKVDPVAISLTPGAAIGTRIGPYKIREQIGEGGMGEVYVAEQTEPVRRKVALKIIKPGMATKDVVGRFEAERQALAMMDHPNIARVFDGGVTQGQPYFVMELVQGVPITDYCDGVGPVRRTGLGNGYQASHRSGIGSARRGSPGTDRQVGRAEPSYRRSPSTASTPSAHGNAQPPTKARFSETGLPIRTRLELFLKVCRAVHHAHQKGIIHRDLKPSNILVAEIDGAAVPKVIDFGVAKAIDQKLTEQTVYTQFSQLVGTPLYMSPEQVGVGVIDVDTRSDVYSLGVLLYELLTGSTPFDRETLKRADYDELRRIIREDQPRRPSAMVSTLAAADLSTVAERRGSDPRTLSSALRGELDWLVMKALEKDRGRRYESAAALAEDVERYLADQPVLARPPSTAYRVRKFVRRNRALVASVSAVILALGVGLTLATVGFLTAQKRLAEVTEEQENNEILIKVLGDEFGFPWGRYMYGEEQTMLESLQEFTTQLETRFQDRPKLEIKFRLVVAHAHYKLGEHTKARQHLQMALDLAEREYGPVHELVADILTDLAHDVQRHREDNSLAEDLLIIPFDPTKGQADAQRAMDIYKELDVQTLGRGHAVFCLAWYLEPNLTRHEGAESNLREALAIARGLAPGEDSHRQLYAMWDLVEHLTWQKPSGTDEAQSLIREAVAMSRRFMGEEDALTAGLIGEMGELYRFLGKGYEEEALRSYHEAWSILTEITPPNNLLPHSYGLTLAEVYFVADRHQEGMQILAQVESDCRDREMDSYVRCQFLRGWAHLLREDYAAAELCFQRAATLAKEELDGNHAYTLLSQFHFARTLDARGKQAEAQEQYQKVLPLTRARVQLPHARQMELFAHAWSLLHSGSTDEQTLREALDAAEQGLARAAAWPQYGSGPHLHLAKAIAQYKLAKMRNQDIEPAIQTLREGLNQHEFIPLRPRHKHVPMSRHELEAQLAEWLAEKGNEDEAVQVLRDAVVLRSEHFGDDHPKVASAERRLRSFLANRGENETD